DRKHAHGREALGVSQRLSRLLEAALGIAAARPELGRFCLRQPDAVAGALGGLHGRRGELSHSLRGRRFFDQLRAQRPLRLRLRRHRAGIRARAARGGPLGPLPERSPRARAASRGPGGGARVTRRRRPQGGRGGREGARPGAPGGERGPGKPGAPRGTARIELRDWLFLAAILIASFVVYIPALDNDFTNWDDNFYVTDNPIMMNPTLDAIVRTPVAGNYHPLTMWSLALNYKASRLDPAAYHWTNVWIHVANTALVFFFVWVLSRGRRWTSIAAAA